MIVGRRNFDFLLAMIDWVARRGALTPALEEEGGAATAANGDGDKEEHKDAEDTPELLPVL